MKILFLVPRVPYPLEKGDKLRAYLHAQHLSKKHEVHLCCIQETSLHPKAEEELRKISSELTFLRLKRPLILWNLFTGLFSSKPFQVHYFFQGHLKRRLHRLLKEDPPDHILCQLIRSSEYVKDVHHIPKTLDYMDAFSKGLERRKERSGFPMDLLMKEESRRATLYENLAFEYFDQHTIISEQDRTLIAHPLREEIQVLPNGIDTDHYRPMEAEKDKELLFTGNMSYPPNVESARALVYEILPILREEGIRCRILIAGVDPVRRVRELHGGDVEVSGWVPDIREAYLRSRIFIAPMVLGSGLQNKLLEAMAMGLPSITTPLANKALGAPEGETILVGRSKETLADQIRYLLENEEERERLARAGRAFVKEHYDLRAMGEHLERSLKAKASDQQAERAI